jgi:hypothetical protein
MHTRIEKDAFFQAAIHFEGCFYVNTYEITLSMLVETESIREQMIALERLNCFLTSSLQNCLFIEEAEIVSIENYKKAGIRICELPEEPLDQIIGMVLLQKFNAIMENRIIITDITLGSLLSEGVRHHIVAEIAESTMSGDFWWNKPGFCLCSADALSKAKGDNIVKLFDDSEWAEMGLTWKEKASK